MSSRGGGVFGLPDTPETMQLQKALQAGSGGGLSSSDGRAIVLEDLEGVLHSTTYGTPQFENTLWNQLKARSVPATAIMHEFSKMTGRGRTGVFGSEIATVNTLDAQLKRDYAQVRFLRTVFEWSHVIGLVQKVEDQKTIQAFNATMHLTEALERGFYEGDSAIVANEMDGLYKIVKAAFPANVINMLGKKLDKANLINGTAIIARNYGRASHLFHATEVQQNLDLELEGDKDRIALVSVNGKMQLLPAAYIGESAGIMYGHSAAGLRTSFGNVKFSPHLFSEIHPTLYLNTAGSEAATSTRAPATPTFTAVAAAEATSLLAAGNYRYRVSAENEAGESVAAAVSIVAVTAGQKVTVTPSSGGGSYAPTGYRVYRSKVGGAAGSEVLIARIAGVGGTYVDLDQRMAGTKRSYMIDLDSPGAMAAIAWAQLAKMQTYGLPMGDTFYRNMLFLYGVLTCYAPQKVVIFDNVGDD